MRSTPRSARSGGRDRGSAERGRTRAQHRHGRERKGGGTPPRCRRTKAAHGGNHARNGKLARPAGERRQPACRSEGTDRRDREASGRNGGSAAGAGRASRAAGSRSDSGRDTEEGGGRGAESG